MEPIKYPNKARALRERLLSQPAPSLKPVEIDGETYHLRVPLISQRDEIVKLALPPKVKRKGGAASKAFREQEEEDFEAALKSIPIDRMMAAAAIVLVCDDTGASVFEPADFDTIRTSPVGSWIEKIASAALAQLRPEESSGPGEASGDQEEDTSISS